MTQDALRHGAFQRGWIERRRARVVDLARYARRDQVKFAPRILNRLVAGVQRVHGGHDHDDHHK